MYRKLYLSCSGALLCNYFHIVYFGPHLSLTIFLNIFFFSNNWECHNPYSNVLWIRYLIDKVLNAKKFKKANNSLQRNIRTYLRQVLSYESAFKAVRDGFLGLVFNDGL